MTIYFALLPYCLIMTVAFFFPHSCSFNLANSSVITVALKIVNCGKQMRQLSSLFAAFTLTQTMTQGTSLHVLHLCHQRHSIKLMRTWSLGSIISSKTLSLKHLSVWRFHKWLLCIWFLLGSLCLQAK